MKLISTLLFCVFSVSHGRDYAYLDYDAIAERISELAETYPDFIRVTTAQEEYGLPSPGQCGDAPCVQHIVKMTNFLDYEEHKVTRPQVFFSGALHGDERVGPTATAEFLTLMMEKKDDNPWIRRLLNTRLVVLTPMTNALGYYRNERGEDGIDCNRDFPIDYSGEPDSLTGVTDDGIDITSACMNTVCARVSNEVFLDHMFQLAITFHSGVRMLGYEWGTVTHQNPDVSADGLSQAAVGNFMSAFAGEFPEANQFDQYSWVPEPERYENRKTYPNGPITPLVYPVTGGMEDWGYASSWSFTRNACNSTTFGGYPIERTLYNSSQLRVFNMLVESEWEKTPDPSTLGTDDAVLKANGEGTGNIPRHIRLMLAQVDSLQPYIHWAGSSNASSSCNAADLDNDLDPAVVSADDGTQLPHVEINTSSSFSLSYEVGGSFSIDSSRVKLYKASSILNSGPFSSLAEFEAANPGLKGVYVSKAVSGYSRLAGGSFFGSSASSTKQDFDKDFAEISLDSVTSDWETYPIIPAWKHCFVGIESGEYVAVAFANVDSFFATIPEDASPLESRFLQAHYAQARTNTSWVQENNGFVIKGQTEWLSSPLRISLVNTGADATDENEGSLDETIFYLAAAAGVLALAVSLLALVVLLKGKSKPEVVKSQDASSEEVKHSI